MFQFVLYFNCGHILYHFQDKARYWSNVAIFFIPLSTQQPPSCVKTLANIFALFVFATNPDLSTRFCKKFSVISQLTRVTDRRTDKQTDRQTEKLSQLRIVHYVTLAKKDTSACDALARLGEVHQLKNVLRSRQVSHDPLGSFRRSPTAPQAVPSRHGDGACMGTRYDDGRRQENYPLPLTS